MKTWLAGMAFIVLTVGSVGLAVHDDGGGGGAVYTKRTPNELRQLLQDYRARRDALRRALTEPAPEVSSTLQRTLQLEAEEMLRLQQLAYEAQAARLQAVRVVSAR